MFPRHVGVHDALQDAHRATGLDQAAEQKMVAAFLDQRAGDEIGLIRRILRRPRPHALLLQLLLDGRREPVPHQHLGEIDRGCDQHHAGDRRRPAFPAPHQFAHQQQRQPAAHRGADQDLRAAAAGVEHREAVGEPAADRAVRERAAGFAVPRIIETHDGAAFFLRPGVERRGLGALHVGFVAAEPDQPRRRAVALADREGALVLSASCLHKIQAAIIHSAGLGARGRNVDGSRDRP